MAELLKDFAYFFKEVRRAWKDFRLLRKRRRSPLPKKVPDKRVYYGNRTLCAPVEASWPTNISEILNEDGSPKPPWKEL